MENPGNQERRAVGRLSIQQEVDVVCGDEIISCRLTDISPNGLGLIASKPFPELSILGLELDIEGHEGRPDLRVVANAVVIHCVKSDQGHHVGLWFQEISEFLRLNIESYMLATADS